MENFKENFVDPSINKENQKNLEEKEERIKKWEEDRKKIEEEIQEIKSKIELGIGDRYALEEKIKSREEYLDWISDWIKKEKEN